MPRPNKDITKAKDFKGAIKRLLKELSGFKKLVIISLVLAALGAILTIVTPNILSDLTDEISKGLVLNKDNFLECDFIYLYDIDKDFYITIDSNLLVLFYDAYTKFNYKFMYMLARVWIDSYTIDNDCYTTITFEGDDYTVTSYKRRGKTIHKKLIS